MLNKLKRFFKRSHFSLFVYVFSAWFVFMPIAGTAQQVEVANKVAEVTSQMGGFGNFDLDSPADIEKAISQLVKQLDSMSPAELTRNLHKMVNELSKVYEQAIKQDKELYNALNTMKPTEFMDYITNRLLDTLNQVDMEKAITEVQNTPITEEYVAQVNEILKQNNIKQRVTKRELEQIKEQVAHVDTNKIMDAVKQLNVELPNIMTEIKSKYGDELDKRYATAKALIDDALKQMNNYKITKKDIDMLKDVLTNIAEGKTVNDNELAKDTNQIGGISAAMNTFFSRIIPNIILCSIPLFLVGAIIGAIPGWVLGFIVGIMGIFLFIFGIFFTIPIGIIIFMISVIIGGLIVGIIGVIPGVILTIMQSIAAFFDTGSSGGGDAISIKFN